MYSRRGCGKNVNRTDAVSSTLGDDLLLKEFSIASGPVSA
jgi:hypothetical protein